MRINNEQKLTICKASILHNNILKMKLLNEIIN